ncbi:MAG: class I SAM-dependent methyltransferase [Prevotella sp.]|jgi:2-polyprenyl-3-methyl-5-hydroxy-6-metoxy-1,4-benzoquinol methylase|nr:class I SAM-dependent methyltransferase [Prevotella sp.]
MISKRYGNDGKSFLRLNSVQKYAQLRVKRKIIEKSYTFEEVLCPVCGSSNYDKLAEKDRYGLYCNTVICKDCGLLIINPTMTQKSLEQFYLEDYRELYSGSKKTKISYFTFQYTRGKKIIDFIRKHDNSISFQNKFVIEIGCGAGGILSAFRDTGAKVMGFDLGVDYLEYGINKYGLFLKKGTIEDYNEEKKPDIIIYSHVLEHVRLPDELYKIKKICHEKTMIYVEVPGLLSIQKPYGDGDFMKYLQNAHLYHFSLGTLTNLFSKYGFSLLYGDEFIRSVFVLETLSSNISNISNISNYYDENINYLMETESNRIRNTLKRYIYGIPNRIFKKILRIYFNNRI